MKLLNLVLPLTLLFYAPNAWAGSMERAAAITAFDEAQAMMEKGAISSACAKFQESYDLDAQLGSLLHLADCRQQNGQIASAWSGFLSAAEWAEKNGDERADVAQQRAAELAPQLSHLTLKFAAPLPQGAVLTRNGKEVPQAMWTRDIPLDPGAYRFEATAEGYQPWTAEVTIQGKGSSSTLQVPALVAIAPDEKKSSNSTTAATSDDSNKDKTLLANKWPALVAAGVGVAGGVVWGIFGAQSMQAKSDADELCGKGFKCIDASGTDLRDKAFKTGNLATIGTIVTGVGIATAGVLWFVLPNSRSKETIARRSRPLVAQTPVRFRLGVHATGASLQGSF